MRAPVPRHLLSIIHKIWQAFGKGLGMQGSKRLEELLGETGRELTRQLNEVHGRLTRLEHRLDDVEEVLRTPARDKQSARWSLERELIDHRESIKAVRAVLTAQRTDVGRGETTIHRAIAKEFDHFVEYHLFEVVNDAVNPAGEQEVARHIGDLSRALFHESFDSAEPETVTGWLADRGLTLPLEEVADLRNRAAQLKEQGRTTGFPAHWNFDAKRNTPVDLETQSVWTGSDRSAPVDAVVAPAYQVGDRTFSRQRVLTTRPAAILPSAEVEAK